MFKTLAGRALIPVGMAVTGFVILCFLLLYSAIREVVNRDSVGHATNLADTILKSTRYAMLKSDREMLTTIVNNVGQQKGVEHIRIFNKRGIVNISTRGDELNHQVDKNAEGCIICHSGAVPAATVGKMEQARTYRNRDGTEIMAITAPIYNEPECSNAACHVHPPELKVLGTLDIGLSREMSLDSLASIRYQMFAFTVMILLLTIGGVSALLLRSVFLPLKRLRTLSEQAEQLTLPDTPPAHFPRELDSIALSLCNLSKMARKSSYETSSQKSQSVEEEI